MRKGSIEEWTKTCLRKKRLSCDYADKVIERAKTEGKNLYKYYCPHCFHYHITSKPRQ